MAERPIPLLGDISLSSVQRIEHSLDAGFASTPIAGLAGELQQRANRLSHRLRIQGSILGATAADDLAALETAAAAGEELTFSADISKALDLQKVVIVELHAAEVAGQPGVYFYDIALAESPPLPPPAQVSGFGGLDDFGLGDLGFDTDVLGDLESLAGDIAGAVNDALQVVDALGALANMDGLSLGNFLTPISDTAGRLGTIGSSVQSAFQGLSDALR
jgi:hypothetical protein